MDWKQVRIEDSFLFNKLLSLVAFVFLTMMAVKEMSVFFDPDYIKAICILSLFSGTLYFIASFLLLFDFLNLKKEFIKNKIWVMVFLLGFLIDVIGWFVESIVRTYFA